MQQNQPTSAAPTTARIRKIHQQVEQTFYQRDGAADPGQPLTKAAVCAVVQNPYAGQGFVAELSEIIALSEELGAMLGGAVLELLDGQVHSYGKAGLVGLSGVQEHANAALTSVFGDAFRKAIGGGDDWITSTTKACAPGSSIDVPLAYKDDVWIRDYYDTITVTIPDAPCADEIVVIAAGANRARIGARLGGKKLTE